MRGRLYHWNPTEADELAVPLRQAGWEVQVEAEDGTRGAKNILGDPPNAVLIFIRRLPSHGRETAEYIHSYESGTEIPFVFVDGEPSAVQQLRDLFPEGTFTDYYNLLQVLEQFG